MIFQLNFEQMHRCQCIVCCAKQHTILTVRDVGIKMYAMVNVNENIAYFIICKNKNKGNFISLPFMLVSFLYPSMMMMTMATAK